jgi:hypothetical protein
MLSCVLLVIIILPFLMAHGAYLNRKTALQRYIEKYPRSSEAMAQYASRTDWED